MVSSAAYNKSVKYKNKEKKKKKLILNYSKTNEKKN